jgi:hypothetical protein
MEKKIVTFITYYDIEKQLLNYKIPRELNYYSLDQAIVYVEKNINNYNYNLLIPQSFYLLDSSDFLLMTFNVTGLIVNKDLMSKMGVGRDTPEVDYLARGGGCLNIDGQNVCPRIVLI